MIMRLVLAIVSLTALFYPDDKIAYILAAFILPFLAYGVFRHRRVAPPKALEEVESAA